MALKAKNVDISKISISKPKKLDFGGSMVYVNYDGGIQPLYIQTPELYIPFDMSYFSDNESDGKWNIKVSFQDLENNKGLREFYEKIKEFDEFIKDEAEKNAVSWFRGKKSREVIDSLFNPMIKVHMDPETGEPSGKYPDGFGFKIVKKKNKVECSVYNQDNVPFDVNKETENPVDIENVVCKGAKVRTVLKCNGIWIANGKFGCTWRAEQIRAKVPEGGLNAFAILSDSDDEDEGNGTTNNLVDDSDNDSDSSEEQVPEPPPEPKKKARKVRVKSDN
tara:strand:+ start:1865 stop:2698 length:834 start_codon:yes stop_codon:yes gene_type:complete